MTRFALITFPRSGTHMVRTALERHPELAFLGEVFNPRQKDGQHGIVEAREVLDRVVWSREPRRGAVGFCAHYFRPTCPVETAPQELRPRLWETLTGLLQAPAVEPLLLTRTNLLRRYISFLIACQTDQWTLVRGVRRRPPRPLTLDAEVLVAELERQQGLHDELRRCFPGALHVTYEELCADLQGTLGRLQRRLGVRALPLAPTSRKQGGSLRDVLTNYDQLKARFAGGPWAACFDEEAPIVERHSRDPS